MKQKYKVGKMVPAWKDNAAQTITFIVTEDCNLRCKYCYITHKTSNKKMNFETAKKFIDFILESNLDRTEAVILDFIGGEPFLEIELITQITNYFKLQTYIKQVDWYWNYRLNISTNGVNYSDPRVIQFIEENMGKVSVGITIDGTKEKHDLQRVFPNNTGSYDAVSANIPLYLSQGFYGTKVTFASDDLKFLKDSIISLWDRGVTDISANVVYEDVWKPGDDLLFEDQLRQLADYIIEHKCYEDRYCSLFTDVIGQYNTEQTLQDTSCGAGKMMALGPDGKIYPCLRYKDYSLNHKEELEIGDVDTGIDMDLIRPFVAAMQKYQSDEECIKCPVARGCNFCQGFNYDEAKTPTIYERAKYICKMHKARVRANDYYFSLLYNRFSIEREYYEYDKLNRIIILLSNDYITYCEYDNEHATDEKKMSKDLILKTLQYAREQFALPIFVHSSKGTDFYEFEEFEQYRIIHIISADFFTEASKYKDSILVFNQSNYTLNCTHQKRILFVIDARDVRNLSKYLLKLYEITDDIIVNFTHLDKTFDEKVYKEELMIVSSYIAKELNENFKVKETNLITDLCKLEKRNQCLAGDRSFTVGPDGRIYVCSAFYSEDQEAAIGNVVDGSFENPNGHLYSPEFQPICHSCDAIQCKNCCYHNVKGTHEVNISPAYQCVKSHIEREVSKIHRKQSYRDYPYEIADIDYKDPIVKTINDNKINKGYFICE